MPCLSGTLNSNSQIIVNVGASGVESAGSPAAGREFRTFPAPIDTGANRTCINGNVVKALKLLPIGKEQMRSASHTVETNLYLIDLALQFGGMTKLEQGKTVLEYHSFDAFDIIIGMDLIAQGSLNVSLDKRFVFCL